MTVSYLKHQKSQIDYERITHPKEANERLEELKHSLEGYIQFYKLPDSWANELRKILD